MQPVQEIIRNHAAEGSEKIVSAVVENLTDFHTKIQPEDDIPLIVIIVKENVYLDDR